MLLPRSSLLSASWVGICTDPDSIRHLQVPQMPARHSESTLTPNSSASVRIGRPPWIFAVLFDREKVTVNSPPLVAGEPSSSGDDGFNTERFRPDVILSYTHLPQQIACRGQHLGRAAQVKRDVCHVGEHARQQFGVNPPDGAVPACALGARQGQREMSDWKSGTRSPQAPRGK